ncbi:MAG: ATP:cob(I)alamin adenosyltransferase [Opitutales bacterium]|jgi:cob(I)alamin adenosyltransferase|nr:ATP:cob(I)alamin adenosyltransferase [Opitutales bacterium]
MKISTKTGDAGRTKLMFGRDVSKASQRVRAYGALDDFSATLGLARSFAGGELAAFVLELQESLVFLMTELATDKADFPKLAEKNIRTLGGADLEVLEKKIEAAEAAGDVFSGWAHSGETHLQAALDMARARCRAAEREIAALAESGELARPFPLAYINRLSDLLWILAQQSLKDGRKE